MPLDYNYGSRGGGYGRQFADVATASQTKMEKLRGSIAGKHINPQWSRFYQALNDKGATLGGGFETGTSISNAAAQQAQVAPNQEEEEEDEEDVQAPPSIAQAAQQQPAEPYQYGSLKGAAVQGAQRRKGF